MNWEFDIYEKVGDNYLWRAVAVGQQPAMRALQELAGASSNEFVVMHTEIKEVIARANSFWPREPLGPGSCVPIPDAGPV
jgi:hypothetical protein